MPNNRKKGGTTISPADRERLSANIQKYRLLQDFSQTKLAVEANSTYGIINGIECQSLLPDVFMCVRIAKALKTTVKSLITDIFEKTDTSQKSSYKGWDEKPKKSKRIPISDEDKTRLTQNIKQLRENNDLLQFQMAEKIGISQSHYANIERTYSVPKIFTCFKIAEMFNTSVEHLAYGKIKFVGV